ncbi:uncharacterized protein NPIL_617011 [Nephila pilipes]|uniref:Uncharacterized protein n=1 Tax=Nephila pilipes TaxID=299642 RepID=A0A8X6NS89_NEPPI|nr:uncharacterized protein NPIL_617011 [Nephila pilipes]
MNNKRYLPTSETRIELDAMMRLNTSCMQELMSDIRGMILKLECLQKKCDLLASESYLANRRVLYLTEETIPLLFNTSTSKLLEDLKNEFLNAVSKTIHS